MTKQQQTQQQHTLSLSQNETITRVRKLVREGDFEALREFLPLVERHGLYAELNDDLNTFLDRAIADNDRGNMTAVQQLAALIGDQDLLLRAQSALIPEREIVLEDDSDMMASVLDSFSMKHVGAGERGIIDAAKPLYTGQPGEVAKEWHKDGLAFTEDDIDEGPSRRDYGK